MWVYIVLPRVSVNIGCWGDGLGELVGVSFDRCFETLTGSSCSADGESIALVKSTSEHTSDWRSLYIHKRQLQRNTTTSAVFLADVSSRRNQIRFDKPKARVETNSENGQTSTKLYEAIVPSAW